MLCVVGVKIVFKGFQVCSNDSVVVRQCVGLVTATCQSLTMYVPCACHVFAMYLPCTCHVLAMHMPCTCHGPCHASCQRLCRWFATVAVISWCLDAWLAESSHSRQLPAAAAAAAAARTTAAARTRAAARTTAALAAEAVAAKAATAASSESCLGGVCSSTAGCS